MKLSSVRPWQRPWSEPKTMNDPAAFVLKYDGHCTACRAHMPAGMKAYGIRPAGARTWTVWHVTPGCDKQAREALRLLNPSMEVSTPHVDPREASPWLDAYDKE